MIRLGLTQRVDVIGEYGERRDCLDQAWTELLVRWGYQPVPLPNTVDEPAAYLSTMDLDGLVLTSGNDLAHLDGATKPAPERDAFEQAALDWAFDRSIPVIGICRGLELLNHYFGGTLSTVDDHVATTHDISFDSLTINYPRKTQLSLPDNAKVNSYHNYGISRQDVAPDLNILATAPDETVEALRHPSHAAFGIMWHPEREAQPTKFDRKLFDTLFTPTQ